MKQCRMTPMMRSPSRLLSLFTSPVIGRDDIVYPDFVGEDVDVPLDSIGEFRDPIP